MNRLEAQETIKRFSRMQPAYSDWRNRQLATNSAANGTDQPEEWSAMLDSIARTLADIDKREADKILDRMESGRHPIPPYGELALTILREAKVARQPANRYHDSQPRYACLNCRDTGIVSVWNPNFVEAYRSEFEKITRSPFDRSKSGKSTFDLNRYDPDQAVTAWSYDPPNWQGVAARWWKSTNGEGSIHHVALCNCNCHRQNVLAQELDAFERGDRRTSDGKRAGAPACGCVRYNSRIMPLKTPLAYDDLHEWYSNNEVNSAYEWTGAQT